MLLHLLRFTNPSLLPKQASSLHLHLLRPVLDFRPEFGARDCSSCAAPHLNRAPQAGKRGQLSCQGFAQVLAHLILTYSKSRQYMYTQTRIPNNTLARFSCHDNPPFVLWSLGERHFARCVGPSALAGSRPQHGQHPRRYV